MIQELTKIYDGANLSGETSGVIYLPILRACSLKGVDIKTDEDTAGDAVFEILKNGVVISGLEAVTISTGTKIETVTGLNIAFAKGDEILLNLLSGAVSSPVTLNLSVDVTVGADEITEVTDRNFATDAEISKIASSFSTAANEFSGLTEKTTLAPDDLILIEDSAAAGVKKKVKKSNLGGDGGVSNGFSYFDPDVPYSSPSAFDDEFTSSSLDAKWTVRGTPTLTHENPYSHLKIVGNSSGIHGIHQPFTSAGGNTIFRAKVIPFSNNNTNDLQAGGIYFKKATTAFSLELTKSGQYFYPIAGYYNNVTSYNSDQASHANIRLAQGTPIWLELDFNFTTGNVIYRYSLDGISFGFLFTDVANAAGVVEVGIKGAVSSVNSTLRVDWFRKLDGTGFTGKKLDL